MKSHKIAHVTPKNRLPLGLHPRARWGAYDASPNPLVGWGGGLASSPSAIPKTIFWIRRWVNLKTEFLHFRKKTSES